MALETGIRDALLAVGGITAKVGTRIRPVAMASDDVRPYLTYQAAGRESLPVLAGPPADYRKADFEVGIFADTYHEVMELSNLVRDRLDQFGDTVSGVEFAPVMFDGETDIEAAVAEGQELPVYVRVQTYKVLYRLVP
jgi:hypothetical protein